IEQAKENVAVRPRHPLLHDDFLGNWKKPAAECNRLVERSDSLDTVDLTRMDEVLVCWLDNDGKVQLVEPSDIRRFLKDNRAGNRKSAPRCELVKFRLVRQA